MTTNIPDYINSLIQYPHPRLALLDSENEGRTDISPNIGLSAASLIDILVRAIGAKEALEFGTCIGFSTITLANALQATGGRLTAVELDERMLAETTRNLESAGLSGMVTLIQGDALEVLDSLSGPYDLILQDSDKFIYTPMLERCVDLLRVGGLLITDDTLFPVLPVPEKYRAPMDEYNRRLFNHPRLASTLLPIGDGLAVSLKIR